MRSVEPVAKREFDNWLSLSSYVNSYAERTDQV